MRRSKEITIKLTRHAQRKMVQRDISLEKIRGVVSTPKWMEKDKLDAALRTLSERLRAVF